MDLRDLKDDLIRDIKKVDDMNLLKRVHKTVRSKLYPDEEIHTDLLGIQQYDVKGTRPFQVQFREEELKVKKWVDLYTGVIKWILDFKQIKEVPYAILDHCNKTQCVVNNKPYHLNGKSFRTEVRHRNLFIDGHGGAEHHVLTLIKLFKELDIPLHELKIGFWLTKSPPKTITVAI
jgi:hypothetical protein